MKLTFFTFAAGTLALIGCPFFSGFFSKDAILLAAWHHNKIIFVLGLLTAALTAYYMTRLFVVVFLGPSRSDAARHVKDGSPLMSGPLAILALLALVAGWGTEHYFAELFPAIPHVDHGVVVPILAVLAFLAGTAGAYVIYNGQVRDPIVVRAFKRKF